MKITISQPGILARLLMVAFALTFALPFGFGRIQTASATQSSGVEPTASAATQSPTQAAQGGQSKSEDDEAALKHSAAVRMLSRATGLDVDTAYWMCLGINFLVLAVLVVMGLRSSLPKAFQDRSQSIARNIEEARNASREASSRLAEIEARLARIDTEIGQMRSHAETAGVQEEERVRIVAEEERRKIQASADQEIEAAANQVRRQLKQFAAELAVSLAEQKISISPATDRALIGDFAANLRKDGQN